MQTTTAAQQLLKAIRGRGDDSPLGITTAYHYVRHLETCLAGNGISCPAALLGVSQFQWQKAVKEAKRQLVYHAEGMHPDSRSIVPVKLAPAPGSLVDLPQHTLATFEHVTTSTRKDRDGDVLETSGANVDPRGPLLLEHIAYNMTGKVVGTIKHNKRMLVERSAIADTAMGNDALKMVEFGAYRISHGFIPTEWEPLDMRSPEGGFHIKGFEIMERSLVSIPSNTDAVILAYSRQGKRFDSEFFRQLGKAAYSQRPAQGRGFSLPANGDTVTLPASNDFQVTLRVEAAKSAEAPCTCQAHGDKEPPPEEKTSGLMSDATISIETLEAICPACGEKARKLGWKRIKLGALVKEMPQQMVEGLCSRLEGEEHPHSRCTDLLADKENVDDPDKVCGWLLAECGIRGEQRAIEPEAKMAADKKEGEETSPEECPHCGVAMKNGECPECGYAAEKTPANATECPHCGEMLGEDGTCPKCGKVATYKGAPSACPECGGKVDEKGVCADCGWKYEDTTDDNEEPGDGKAAKPTATKSGRVLSVKNQSLIEDARDDAAEIAGMEGVPRGGKSLARAAAQKLQEVLDSAAKQEAEPEVESTEEKGPADPDWPKILTASAQTLNVALDLIAEKAAESGDMQALFILRDLVETKIKAAEASMDRKAASDLLALIGV